MQATDCAEEFRFTPKDILLKRDIDFINKIKLDKEYGCLDELDIDITEKDPEEVRKINAMIINYIFEDRSIKIGDKNRIDGTEIRGGENHG